MGPLINMSIRKRKRFRTSSVVAMVFALSVLGLFYIVYAPNMSPVENPINVSAEDKVKVQVYYETHCPDSKDFILTQFYPAYQAIPDIFEGELVPYGKARTKKNPDGSYSFECQHGLKECIGNTIQACALKKVEDQAKVFQFINCMEQASQPQDVASSCAETVGIDYAPIQSCANSDEGGELLAKMGDKTNNLNPKLHFVPWIVIDGKYTPQNQQRALSDLKSLICDKYKNCPNNSSPNWYHTTTWSILLWTITVGLAPFWL